MLTFCQVEILLCRELPRVQAMPGAEGSEGTLGAIGPNGSSGPRSCLDLSELWVREVCRGKTGSPRVPGPPGSFGQRGDGGSPGKLGPPRFWGRISDKIPLVKAGPTEMSELTGSLVSFLHQLNCGEEGETCSKMELIENLISCICI